MRQKIVYLLVMTVALFADSEVEEKVAEELFNENEIVANSAVLEISKENISDIETSPLPVILEVHASWCSACQMMEPVFAEVSAEYEGSIQFAKMDYDSQHELARKFKVSSLPTLLFFKKGQKTPVMKSVGSLDKEEFEAKIQEFLKK